MKDLIALITIMLWPVVPLFWIPVHGLSKIFKRLGLLTYIMPAIMWPPLVLLIYWQRGFLLHYKAEMPLFITIIGVALLTAGSLLHLWTGKLLGLWGLMGLPEISSSMESRLVTNGPFSVVRHPTYLAHTAMFFGVFLFTGVIAVGIMISIDFFLISAIITPMEDRELTERFGSVYEDYKKLVKWKFLPGIL